MKKFLTICTLTLMVSAPLFAEANPSRSKLGEKAFQHFENYCFDCHDGETTKGDLDLANLLQKDDFDGSLIFEHLITSRMPPKNKKQPRAEEKRLMLSWLAQRQTESAPNSYRRISRHEFVHSLNDLLGVKLDLAGMIPEDRGTYNFDSDRRVQLTKEMLTS